MDRYRELAPFDPYLGFYETLDAIAHVIEGDYETGGQRSAAASPRPIPNFTNGYKPLIAALGHLGRVDEAKPYVEKLLALEPNFTVAAHLARSIRFATTYDRDHYMEGLRARRRARGLDSARRSPIVLIQRSALRSHLGGVL